jgi:Zn-dependent protease with chaperone function
MSNVDRIRRIAAELGVEVIIPHEASIEDAMVMQSGGGLCHFATGNIYVSSWGTRMLSDKELSFLVAHEKGHSLNKGLHTSLAATGKVADLLRIELEADAYAVRLTGQRMAGITMLWKASTDVIGMQYERKVRIALWATQLVAQIIPRSFCMLLR